MISEAINYLGLDYEQTELLFNIQYDLVFSDILNEADGSKKNMKLNWLNDWSHQIRDTLNLMNDKDVFSTKLKQLTLNEVNLTDFNKKYVCTEEIIDKVCKGCYNNKLPLYLIYMEACLFVPYFKINQDINNNLLDNVKEKFKKENKLSYKDEKRINGLLNIYANKMNITNISTVNFKKLYVKTMARVSNKNIKIVSGVAIGSIIMVLTAGYAAPTIAAAIAPAGIYGAAATSAGLALLGGGAIAAGGFGMAGGLAVVVGGGALLGSVAGGSAGYAISLIKTSSQFTLSQAAKLEIVIKEILLTNQKDVRMAQELIKEQRAAIAALENEIIKMKIEFSSTKEEIKNMEQSVKYMKKVLEECIKNLNK
ncbi:MAG: hypothetical protein RR942_14125 [Romboutsia sp.]